MMDAAPKPVIPLHYAGPITARRERSWLMAARVCVVLSALCVLVGWVLMFVDIESVIVTGPILMLTGLALVLVAWRLRIMPAALLGIAHCSICALFFTLVNVRSWSPRDAEWPFRVMTGIYLLALTLPASGLLLLFRLAYHAAVAPQAERYEDVERPAPAPFR